MRECECKKEGERKKRKAMKGRQCKRRGEEWKRWRGVKKLGGEGGVSSYCASYYEVDCLLTLYVEGWCSQLSGIVVESKLSTDTKSADWRD